MPKTIIVGAGAIAYAHARALRDLGVAILGVYDVNPESAARLASQYESKPLASLEQYEAMVADVDMVHLCTPPGLRIGYAEPAMRAGCHIITEKPMATTVDDAQTLVAMAEKYGVRIMVDFNHRFRAGFQKLLGLVRDGTLGDITDVFIHRIGMLGGNAGTKNDTWRRVPGMVCGMTIESLSHDIDMIVQLAGGVKDVKADIRGTIPGVPEFDNNAHVSLNLASGAMASIHSSWSAHIKNSARGVIGSKGTAILEGDDLFDFSRLRLRTDAMEFEQVVKIGDTYSLPTCTSYTNATRHFLDCMREGKESTASGAYALETLKISHAILEAAKTQQTVALH
ncbi:MAG: Gfo/Idh/MocA family oxidoreductase [Planctomycetaceae bacterium]|nr:Gfo/Idh/MocA family oxidoreductase [Planctomycetaceae bacterium]